MTRLAALPLISLPLLFFIVRTATADLRLPEHIQVIEAPTDRDYIQFGASSLRGSLLLTGGYFVGEGCDPLEASSACPVIDLYEHKAGTWQRIKSIEIPEGGLGGGQFVSDTVFVVQHAVADSIGVKPFQEVTTWRRDAASGEWIPDEAIRDPYYQVAVMEDLMVIEQQDQLVFYEYVEGQWVEAGPRLWADAAYPTDERLSFGGLLIDGGYAYTKMCREPQTACNLEHKIGVIDLATHSYSDVIDITPFAELNPPYAVQIVGDKMAVQKVSAIENSTYEPIKLYSRIDDVWQQTQESHLTISPESQPGGMIFDGQTLMEGFTRDLYNSVATYHVIFRPDTRGVWMETGRMIFPGGDEFLSAVGSVTTSGKAVAFTWTTVERDISAVGYLEDYEYYLDMDQDGMPVGWEERYGFSDRSYDDFMRDSDEDGIDDRDEFVLITSPVDADTDGDQMPDGWEIDFMLDPTDSSDADTDLDEDGYGAASEYAAGTNPLDSDSKPGGSALEEPSSGSGGGGACSGLVLLLFFFVRATSILGRRSAM